MSQIQFTNESVHSMPLQISFRLKTLDTAEIVRVADLLTLKSVFGGRGEKSHQSSCMLHWEDT